MALEDDLNNYDWGSWDQQAADYLNSSDYLPTYDLGNLDISNVDLSSLGGDGYSSGYNFDLASLLGDSFGNTDYSYSAPDLSSLYNEPNVDFLGSGLGTLKEKDALGGTLYQFASEPSLKGYMFTRDANGDVIGLNQNLGPDALGQGITAYGTDIPASANEYNNFDYQPAFGKDYQSAGERPTYSNLDLMASDPEVRQRLLEEGVITPRAALQYELQQKQDAGDTFINNMEDALRYAKLYQGATDTTAIGGMLNPINQVVAKMLREQELLAKGVSPEIAARIAKESVANQAKEQAGPGKTNLPSGTNLGKLGGALKAAQLLAQGIGLGEKPKAPAARGTAGSASWGPTQQRSARSFYAKGGQVKPNAGGLGGITIAIVDAGRKKGLIPGEESGQEDNVEAMLSPGEYVFDAETVSALGDGNTAAGAKRLDEMRKSVRKHKRGGALSEIAPKAKKAQEYLKG